MVSQKNMTKSIVSVGALIGLAACSSGSSTTGTPVFDPIPTGTAEEVQSAVSAKDDLFALVRGTEAEGFEDGMDNTRFFVDPTAEEDDLVSLIPADGSAVFEGFGVVEIFETAEGADDTTLVEFLGVASITADFANKTLTGGIEEFGALAADGSIAAATGALELTNGKIQPTPNGRPNRLQADFDTTLGAFDTEYALEGRLDGNLRGTNTVFNAEDPDSPLPNVDNPIKALDLSTFNPTGKVVDGEVVQNGRVTVSVADDDTRTLGANVTIVGENTTED